MRLHEPFDVCYEGSYERLLRIAEEIMEDAKILEQTNEVYWSGSVQVRRIRPFLV
jgi:hypothetical protein